MFRLIKLNSLNKIAQQSDNKGFCQYQQVRFYKREPLFKHETLLKKKSPILIRLYAKLLSEILKFFRIKFRRCTYMKIT